MKLGIVVVYLVNEDDEPLLDLHLKQIEEYTQVPYTIYGSANRLLPKFRHKLEQQPNVMICEVPNTDLRNSAEHSHYLECLTRAAIEDGVSHVVTLHVDSFPIRLGWAEELAQKLSETRVFATIETINEPLINTACLFFHRDFYVQYHPRFLLSDDEYSSPEFKQYLRELQTGVHSGIGFGFKAYTEGLSWYYLRESTKGHDRFGLVFDDLIFHLRGAVRIGREPYVTASFLNKHCATVVENAAAVMRLIFKPRTRSLIRALFGLPIEHLLDRPRRVHARDQFETTKRRFVEDPEYYLNQLRDGQEVQRILNLSV